MTSRVRELFASVLLLCAPLCLRSTLYALDKTRSLDQFSYQTWQTGSGLPQNTLRGILQTKDGFLWLATEGGLVRFDGAQFTVFDSRNAPALKSKYIRSLLEDEEGVLWIATAAGVSTFEHDRFAPVPIEGDSLSNNVLMLHNDTLARVWAVTPGGLIRWDPKQPRITPPDRFVLDERSSKLTGAIALGRNQTLWLGTQSGLEIFQNGRFADASGDLPASAVNTLLLDRSSRLWVGTAKGLFVTDERSPGRYKPVSGPYTSGAILSSFQDWEGSIWLGTENGTVRLEVDAQGNHRESRALAGQFVIAMAEDSEGDLWMGTESAGLTVARNQKFVTYAARDGLANDAVRCVFEDHDGVISIGTNAGLTQKEAGRFRQLTTANGLSSNVILSLGSDRDGQLVVGTPDGLDTIRRGGTITTVTSADGLADDFVRSIYKDADRSLWIGTRRGLSHEENPGRFHTFTQADGLGSDLVGAILQDRGGDLWIATLGGLSRMHRGKFVNYRVRDGLSSNVVTALYQDFEGDLWIGTQDAGLNLMRQGKIYQLPNKLGLPTAICGIGEDLNGELWLSSKTGIARANRNELLASALGRTDRTTVAWYGTSDGLRIDECSAGGHPETWRAHDGTLWFSTLKGVAALYPSAAHLNRVLPPVVIEAVRIDDRTFTPAEVQVISPGHSRFAFQYAGLSFAAPQKVIYRYRLDGFDKDWVEAGSERTAYYTNIPPGAYHFRVLARNNDGFWNETGAVMSFRLKPHFYQTLWFYALIGLAIACLAYLVYRWRVGEVEARFNAVSEERNRIAREIHDTLAQDFVGVSVQLEIISRLLATSVEMAREHLDQARLQVRQSLSEARRSIWQLRSQSSEHSDFAARLSKAATQAIGASPVKLILEVRGTYRPLRPTVEDELLKIGGEAVTNALRHAEAGSITIELAYAPKKLSMTISDDGRGFTADASSVGPNGHFGLKGMRERAAQIHARLVVDSRAGQGTKVSVEAPLN